MKKIRYFFESLLLLLFLGLSKCLPLSWASGLGGFIGRTLGPRLAASRKAYRNIQKIYPDMPPQQQTKIITGMWDNLARVMLEFPHLKKIGSQRTTIINAELLDQYKNKPVVFISGHLGNWECCPPALLLQKEFYMHPVYRAPNNPVSDWLLNKARQMGGRLKPIPKSKGGARQMVKILKNNEGIGMLIDQKYNEGIEVDFLGHPAMTFPAFANLPQKFNCPLIPLHIERLKGANFQVTVLPAIPTAGRAIEDIIGDSHALFKTWIEKNPEQWLWLHRRWKS